MKAGDFFQPYTGGEEETTENSILIAVTAPHPESLTASQRGQTHGVSAFNPSNKRLSEESLKESTFDPIQLQQKSSV